MVNYIGDYDYYLEKKEELTEKYAPVQEDIKETPSAGAVSESKLTWQQQKEEQALKRKKENELKRQNSVSRNWKQETGRSTTPSFFRKFAPILDAAQN